MKYQIKSIRNYPQKHSIIHRTVDYIDGEFEVGNPESVVAFVEKHIGEIYDKDSKFLKVYEEPNGDIILDYGSLDSFICLTPKISN